MRSEFFVLKLIALDSPEKNFRQKISTDAEMRAMCFGPVKYDLYW